MKTKTEEPIILLGLFLKNRNIKTDSHGNSIKNHVNYSVRKTPRGKWIITPKKS